MSSLEGFLEDLSAKTTFEDAADLTLDAMLRVLMTEASSRFPEARVLRAGVHVRPFDGYQRFRPLQPDRAARRAEQDELKAPSLGAWHWISKRKSAVAFDVHQNAILGPGGDVLDARATPRRGPLGASTVDRLLKARATHVMVLPLLAPGGGVEGMIDIDVHCRQAVGTAFIWPACSGALALLALAAVPYLLGLPLGEAPKVLPDALLPVVGASMRSRIDLLERFARTNDTLLLTGPTGVGKSRLAGWCHARSRRAEMHFESLDLSTSPEDLQLAELFGAAKGSYTSASQSREGAVARAEKGTLFIDEIDKLSLRAQAGLLKLLEERAYRPIGGERARKANVRFIVGTNINLLDAVEQGRFREDLYYRINVLPVRIPPLDDRTEEIAPWARYMLERRHRADPVQPARSTVRLTEDATRLLERQKWPGNLRELDNAIHQAYVHAAAPGAGDDVVVGEEHISVALESFAGRSRSRPPATSSSNEGSLAEALSRAADLFIDQAAGAANLGPALDIEHARSFADLVLVRAVERLGKQKALERFTSERERANDNHHRRLREAVARADLLEKLLGGR